MRLPSAAGLVLAATTATLAAASARNGDAELVWPDDPRSAAYLRFEILEPSLRPSSAWPRTVGEICGPTRDSAIGNTAGMSSRTLAELRSACAAQEASRPIEISANVGAYALGKTRSLGPTFERFSEGGWRSVRTDAELAKAWTDLPPIIGLEFNHAFSPRLSARFRMGLRRDMAAWHADDLSSNLPLATSEVDINEPSHGWLRYEGPSFSATLGRFPVQWSPSPEFGLTLSSSAAYHTGAELAWKLPRLTYRFLVSSLDPWLEGTPPPGGASEDYPVGSEEWRQRNYPDLGAAGNAHRRVYDARIKTFLAHRLETWIGPLTMGVTEAQVIGGKVPDLRDLNPFALFHNEFREGYTNNNVSVDGVVRLPAGFSLAAELFMDDLTWEETETDSDMPSHLGRMVALRHARSAGSWGLSQSFHAVWTDPFLYGYLQPLNTYASRRILTTNYPPMGDSLFFDKIVVDQPLGYIRGGDAMDLWYRLHAARGRISGSVFAAWLTRGEVSLATPFEEAFQPQGSWTTGVAETELRLELMGSAILQPGLAVETGVGISSYRNRDHLEGKEDVEIRLSAGLTWFPVP
jgi:hypothetical protein